MMHHRTSPRAQRHDYSSSAIYFVTICCKDMQHYFGKVKNGVMRLNELGRVAWKCRKDIPTHYPYVEIDEFICMPNHVHGILIVNRCDVGTQYFASNDKKINKIKRTHYHASVQYREKNKYECASGSLGAIIRGFKIGVMKYAKNNHISFARHGRYHDHIIRNEIEYDRIKKYIQENPMKWRELYGRNILRPL